MLKKLLLVLMLVLVSSTTFAGQLAIPYHTIIAKEGDTVLGTWWNLHHLGFEPIDVYENEYCDLFRAVNPQFFSSDEQGFANPDFNKLKAGVAWNIPIPPVSLVAAAGEVIVLAQRPDGSVVPEIMSQEEAAKEVSLNEQVGELTSQVNAFEDKLAITLTAVEENSRQFLSEIQALRASDLYQQAEKGASFLARPWNIFGVVALIIAGLWFVFSRSMRKSGHDNELTAQIRENNDSLNLSRSLVMEQKEELTTELAMVTKRGQRLREAIEKTNIRLQLPSDLVERNDLEVFVPILRFVDKGGIKVPVVYTAGAPNGIEFDNPKKVLKHLSGDGEAAEKSRKWLNIERRVVTLKSRQSVA